MHKQRPGMLLNTLQGARAVESKSGLPQGSSSMGSPSTKGRSRLESGKLHTAGAEIIALHFVVSVSQGYLWLQSQPESLDLTGGC